jgi:hypothetical protein
MNARLLARTSGYEEHIFDFTTKYLARTSGTWPGGQPRHAYLGVVPASTSARQADAWRFPVIEPHFDAGLPPAERISWNEVTFIYAAPPESTARLDVEVLGLPDPGLRVIPLTQVADSRYYAATALLPAARIYTYALRVGGSVEPDPINPQRVRTANGEELSRFFTDYCAGPVTFEPWETAILQRLVARILPLKSTEQEQFEKQPGGEAADWARLQRQMHVLDQSVAATNYLDKLLAREEFHQLPAYRICLAQIDRILRQRNPYVEPRDATRDDYERLYSEMGSGSVPGWDYNSYGEPSYFLRLLRRHVWTGTFAHPRYGGNGNAAGWVWLQQRYPFAWTRGLEPPWGDNPEYRG